MRAASTYPARRDDVRLLVLDPTENRLREARTPALPELLTPGDLVVLNDAATLPASLTGRDEQGRAVEARLAAQQPVADQRSDFVAVLFGAGGWRQRTEDRPPPPPVGPGARLIFGSLVAEVVEQSAAFPRLVRLRFLSSGGAEDVWRGIFREGRPVQYSYLAHDLPLWAVQTVYASRPWAFEMPSAGRPLSWEILLGLRRRGVQLASLTHAAGLSATGDPALDAVLPLPERFDVPARTVRSIADTRRTGGRVIAVGTTVVRALEGAMANRQHLEAGSGVTDLRIDHRHRPRIVDGILSGVHAAGESHFQLLSAWAPPALLESAAAYADRNDFVTHELGDAMLILPRRRARGINAAAAGVDELSPSC